MEEVNRAVYRYRSRFWIVWVTLGIWSCMMIVLFHVISETNGVEEISGQTAVFDFVFVVAITGFSGWVISSTVVSRVEVSRHQIREYFWNGRYVEIDFQDVVAVECVARNPSLSVVAVVADSKVVRFTSAIEDCQVLLGVIKDRTSGTSLPPQRVF